MEQPSGTTPAHREREAERCIRLGLPIHEIESDEEFRFALAHRIWQLLLEHGLERHPSCPLVRCRRANQCRGVPRVYHAMPCQGLLWPGSDIEWEDVKAMLAAALRQRLGMVGPPAVRARSRSRRP